MKRREKDGDFVGFCVIILQKKKNKEALKALTERWFYPESITGFEFQLLVAAEEQRTWNGAADEEWQFSRHK